MSDKFRTFLKRLFSTVLLLLLLGGALWWNSPVGYGLLICLLCNLTSWEWFCMTRAHRDEVCRPLALGAGLLYPWLMFGAVLLDIHTHHQLETGNINSFVFPFDFSATALGILVLYTLIVFFCGLFRMDYRGKSGAQALAGAGLGILGFIYPVWLFAFSLSALTNQESIWTLLWLVLVTKLSDIFAYLCGVSLGGRFIHRRFSPVVSPKKSWEGIIGSFFLTSLCGYALLGRLADFPFPLETSTFFCVLMPAIFILSVAGDLAGSLIKRGLNVKDSGSLLPGIGGIFDLLDSPAFTVSFFVAVLVVL